MPSGSAEIHRHSSPLGALMLIGNVFFSIIICLLWDFLEIAGRFVGWRDPLSFRAARGCSQTGVISSDFGPIATTSVPSEACGQAAPSVSSLHVYF
jgi:hypothetical protein